MIVFLNKKVKGTQINGKKPKQLYCVQLVGLQPEIHICWQLTFPKFGRPFTTLEKLGAISISSVIINFSKFGSHSQLWKSLEWFPIRQ